MAKDPIKALEAIEKSLDRKLAKILNEMAFRIRNRVKGPPGLLKWKSRRIPVVVEKAKLVGQVMTVVVRGASGWKWGHVHIGPPGSTTIKAKSGMLAIPTEFARVNKGLLRRQGFGTGRYSGLIAFAGVLWGRVGWGSRSFQYSTFKQRKAAGETFKKEDLVPLFILKGSVVVRRRIIPQELIRWIRPQLRGELIKGGLLKP